MAVTVEQTLPSLTLDADDTIVVVGPAARAVFGASLGESVWERFPDAKPLYGPHYDRVRRTGEPTEFVQFFRGQVGWVRVVPDDGGRGRITLSWRILHVLDTLTVESLLRSIAEAIELLGRWDVQLSRQRTRELLRVIEGGT